MKYNVNAFTALALALLLLCFPVFSGLAESPADALSDCYWEEKTENGPAGSFVSYPVLIGRESPEAQALAEKINGYIQEAAQIPAYIQLLSTISAGGTGLKMVYDTSALYGSDDYAPYISLVFSAKGKMLAGRPSQVYYPMTLNMATGEPVAFEDLFTDPEGAKAFIEAYLEEEVEPTLSTYLENNQLFPVPYDRFFLDGNGSLILYYENSQLSFLSGDSGAVAFRYSELWDWLDTSAEGIPMQVLWHPEKYLPMYAPDEWNLAEKNDEWMNNHSLYGLGAEIYVGMPLEEILRKYPAAADSDYYPGGACYELEHAALRGTLILTDGDETAVTGVLTSRVDHFGINTGKTTLAEAETLLGTAPSGKMTMDEATAAAYRVCPGTASIYIGADMNGRKLSFTLYADENGIVQYIKLALE